MAAHHRRRAGSWRLLKTEFVDPHLNVALDHSILLAVERGFSPNTLRLWRNERSVVLGRHQRLSEEVNLDACRRHGVSVVRRFTGGGAVYHDLGNLNWTIVAGKADLPSSGVLESFRQAGEALLEALARLGVDAWFEPPNSIHVSGGKITGMASYIKRNAMLIHGTLLIHSDVNVLKSTLKRVKVKVTTLKRELGWTPDAAELEDALISGFMDVYEVDVSQGSVTRGEWMDALSLAEKTRVWTPKSAIACTRMAHFNKRNAETFNQWFRGETP